MLDSSMHAQMDVTKKTIDVSTIDKEASITQDNSVELDDKKSKVTNLKHSYTIPCTSLFRDQVTKLADRRKVNVADLARSVLLMVSDEEIAKFPDSEDPGSDDRETVILKSGPSEGKPWRRKPRLQVRMAPGYDVLHIRKALNLALHMAAGKVVLNVDSKETLLKRDQELYQLKKELSEAKEAQKHNNKLPETLEEIDRLQAIVSVLSFDPLSGGVQDRSDALHILGFPPRSYPSRVEVRARFRMLATIHHPDGKYGSHERMSQLNQAMEILR